MNITISKNASTSKKSKKTDLQKRFDKLLRDLKNRQKANETLKSDLSELYRVYQDRVLPVEQLSLEPYSDLAERLINFFSRKSLAKWQREELSQWIMECIEHVDSIDSEASDKLYQSYRQGIADYLEVDLEEVEAQAKQAEECLDEIFENFDTPTDDAEKANPSEQPGFQEDMFGFSGFESENESVDQNNYEDVFGEGLGQEKQKNKDFLSDKWLKVMFRRAANALHPDKESDEEKKLEKEILMSQLLTARDQNDIFSLLNIYVQHVDSGTLEIAEESMENLCEQLNNQKKRLDEEKYKIIYENPHYASIYDTFYSKNKKTQNKKIERHLKQVNDSIRDLSQFSTSIRNLKVLKVHLASRYDDFQFMRIDNSRMPDFF